jgi:hypothetical protein
MSLKPACEKSMARRAAASPKPSKPSRIGAEFIVIGAELMVIGLSGNGGSLTPSPAAARQYNGVGAAAEAG